MSENAERKLNDEVVRALAENHRRFLAFLQRRLRSREAAEDILQDAFVRSIHHAAELRARESATAWFYRLLRNALIDYYRRQEAEQRALERVASTARDAVVDDDELMRAACDCVVGLVETLKPEYAEAIRRIDLDGASVGAFAKEAGITPGNAAVRAHRARHALRRQLTASCGTCATHGCFDCSCSGLQV